MCPRDKQSWEEDGGIDERASFCAISKMARNDRVSENAEMVLFSRRRLASNLESVVLIVLVQSNMMIRERDFFLNSLLFSRAFFTLFCGVPWLTECKHTFVMKIVIKKYIV